MLRVMPDGKGRADLLAGLDEICRLGARRMLAAAVQAEADAYVDAFIHEVDEQGHRLVVEDVPTLWELGDGPTSVQAAG